MIRGDFKNALAAAPAGNGGGEVIQLPLLGKIAAGTPIEALRDNSNSLGVPAAMLGAGEHYSLSVEGDSMVDAGILDGDTVILQRTDTADSGTIVVALIDNNEVTLKRLRRRGDLIAPKPPTRLTRPASSAPIASRFRANSLG